MGVASVAAMSAADTNSPIVLLSDGAIFRPPLFGGGEKGVDHSPPPLRNGKNIPADRRRRKTPVPSRRSGE
jgi:hypothetical protein